MNTVRRGWSKYRFIIARNREKKEIKWEEKKSKRKCVCVCVCKRERERERERKQKRVSKRYPHTFDIFVHPICRRCMNLCNAV